MIALAPFGAGFLAGHPFEAFHFLGAWRYGENAGEDTEGTNEDTPAETEEENTFSFQNLPDLDTVITYMADSCFTSRDSAKAVLLLLCILTAYGLIGLVVSRKRRMQYLLYLFLALSWVFSLILYLCYFVGLPCTDRNETDVYLSFYHVHPALCRAVSDSCRSADALFQEKGISALPEYHAAYFRRFPSWVSLEKRRC